MPAQKRVKKNIQENIMNDHYGSKTDQQVGQDLSKQLQTFSHSKILTDHAGVQLWSDPRAYSDPEFRNKALQTYSAQMASKSGYIKAADQLYDHLRSVTDTFIATYKSTHALNFGGERYKITFDMKPIYAQAFIPLEVGKNLKAESKFSNIASQETIDRYLQLFQDIKDGKISEEACKNYSEQNLRENACTLYYRMYEKSGDGYYYDHITVPKKPSADGALFGSIGSYEAISTSDAGLSFMYLFLRDFVLYEYKIDKAPGKIISTKIVSTGKDSRKELLEHDIKDYIVEFDVYPESKNTALLKSDYVGQKDSQANEDGFVLKQDYYDIMMAYGKEYANTIKSVLSTQYVQMHTLASVEDKEYDFVCQNSFVGTKLSSLRQLICQDLIQLSKLTLANRHQEHLDDFYASRDEHTHSDNQLELIQDSPHKPGDSDQEGDL